MVNITTFNEPSIGAQLAELKRERGMRNRVYPHLIATKKLTQNAADYQNLCLSAAIRTLEALMTNEVSKHDSI